MPLTEKELMLRDANRNIGEELLEAIRDVKAGRHGATHQVEVTEAAEARSKTGFPSQDLPKCWEFRCARFRNGSKVGACRLARRDLYCKLPPHARMYFAKFYNRANVA